MKRKLLLFVRFLLQFSNNLFNKKSPVPSFWQICLAMFFVINFGFAQTNTWDGSSNTDWYVAANWSRNEVPLPAHDVVIPNVTNKPIISTGGAVCATLNITNTGTGNNTLTINSSGTLTTGAITITAPTQNSRNTVINVVSGTLNASSITMNTSGSDTRVNSLSIGSDGIVNVTNNVTMGTSTQRSNITFSNTGNGLLNVGGTISGGSLSAPSGTVNYNNNGAQTVGGPYTYYNFTVSGGGDKTLNAAITVGNNLLIQTPGTRLIDDQKQITGNNVGTLTAENGTVLFLGRTTVGGTTSTVFPTLFSKARIFLLTGSTVQYNGFAAQTISYVPDYFHLELQFGAKSTSGAGVLTVLGDFGTGSDVTLASCTTFNLSGNFNLKGAGASATLPNGNFYVAGNFNRDTDNAALNIIPGTGTVIFNGTSPQLITGKGVNNFTFYNLTINNSSGVSCSTTTTYGLNDDIVVTNTLTMTSGNLTTSTSNLLNVTRTANNAIVGGSATSFINGPVRWTLPTNSSTSTFLFPVGKGAEYLPFSLISPSTTSIAGATAQVEAFDTGSPGATDNTTLATLSTTEYWSLLTSANFTNSRIAVSRQTAISPLDALGGRINTGANYSLIAGTATANGVTTTASIGTNRLFALARIRDIVITSVASPFCAGSTFSVPYTVRGPAPIPAYSASNTFTVQLSDASGSFASPTSIGNTTSTTSGSINVSIPTGIGGGTGYKMRIVSSSPVITGTEYGNVTINAIQAAPSVASFTDIDCVNSTGTIRLGNLPSGAWTINQTGQATATLTGSGTPYDVTGLAAGSYTFTVQTSTTCASTSVSQPIADNSTSTWNGSTWVGGAPTSSKRIVIASDLGTPFPTGTPVVNGCSLTVNSGVSVIVQTGVTLVITNAVTTNGQLTFRSGSSLMQTTNVGNTGQINYERTTNVRRMDATYWSMPVTNAAFTMATLSPNTLLDKYYWYDPTSTWTVDLNGGMPMAVGKGYNIRAPQSFDTNTPAPFTGVFVGVPNNGPINPTVVQDRYNLVGNPYPSAISASALINGNTNLGTLYFWTHNSSPVLNPLDGKYYYNDADFAAFNLTGGTDTSSGANLNGQPFQGYIAAGQGFLARPKTPTLSFTNSMRRSGNNTQFYKTAESEESNEIERNRLWLNFSNDLGAFKQALIGYIEGATNSFDINFDANTLGSNTSADFYSINESNNMTIQGRALPFDNKDIVPLGYKAATAGEYTISIDHADGFFDTQEVYLEDLTTSKIINLRTENYKFTTEAGTFANRFNLRYTSKTLGTGEFEDFENSLVVSLKNKVLKITSSKETIKDVNIYNVGAQLLYTKTNINSTELQISNLNSGSQVLLVKITLENGHTLTKKIVYSNL